MPRRPADAPRLESRFLGELAKGGHIIAAFSGGADSVSLLHRLWALQGKLSLTLEAVHLNHGLRGAESERDEGFVRAFCRQFGVPLTVRRTDIAALAKKRRLSEETCGREERYRFFDECREKAALSFPRVLIATAHTLSDDLETALFRLARGTGPDGLCGIPLEREGIIRPLLRCSREMVEDYCRRQGLDFVTDSTNADPAYARNLIRLAVIPALKRINPALEESFLRLRLAMEEDKGCLESLTDALLAGGTLSAGVPLAGFAGQPPALAHRAAKRLLLQSSTPVNQKNVLALSELIGKEAGRLELCPGKVFAVRKKHLVLEEMDGTAGRFAPVWVDKMLLADGKPHFFPLYQTNLLSNLTRESGKKLRLQVISAKDWPSIKKVYENLLLFSVDYDTIDAGLAFRSREPGDRLAQQGRPGSRTLKKLFQEAGLPAPKRQTALVAADASGVVWAEGFGIDRRLAAGPGTERLLTACMLPARESDTMEKSEAYTMHDDIEKILLTEEQIAQKVKALGDQITQDYQGKNLMLVSVLKGSVAFMADLMRAIDLPCRIDFMCVSSYGAGTSSSGVVRIIKDLDIDLHNMDLLLVEDILDSGKTLHYITRLLSERGTASIRIATLLDKPERRAVPLSPDYCCFSVPDEFVVGYGLDYNELYRNLPYIGVLKPQVYQG